VITIDGLSPAQIVAKAKALGLIKDPEPVPHGRTNEEIWLSMMNRKFYRALWTDRQRQTRPWMRAKRRAEVHAAREACQQRQHN
jgi:hypothetical protein